MPLPIDELLSFTPLTHTFSEEVDPEGLQERLNDAIEKLIKTPAYGTLTDAYHEAHSTESELFGADFEMFQVGGIATPPSKILLSISLFEQAMESIGITGRKFTAVAITTAKGRITPASLYANANETAFVHKYAGEFFGEFTTTSDTIHATKLDAANMDPLLHFDESEEIYDEETSKATIRPTYDGALFIRDATRILKHDAAVEEIANLALKSADEPDNDQLFDFIADVSGSIRHFMRSIEVHHRYALEDTVEFTYKFEHEVIATSAYGDGNHLIGPENIPEEARFNIHVPGRTHQAGIGAVAIRAAEHQLLGRPFGTKCAPWRDLVDRITSAMLDHYEDLPRLGG